MGWPITHPSTIYAIRCKPNSRVYIGRTYRLEKRIREHFTELRRGQKTAFVYKGPRALSMFQTDYNKYGEDAFEVYILEQDVPPEKCKEREAYWISEYHSVDPRYGYNRYDEHLKPIGPVPKAGLPPKKYYKGENRRKNQPETAVGNIVSRKEQADA